ncbi:MAG: hypothetical protein RBS06_08390, partial [Arenimonas caeni]|nr:hypothetical protein [Arenimonas caeni]
RGHCEELPAAEVDKLRRQFQLEDKPPVLTLQPVIGQRKSRPTQIRVGKDSKQASYVNGAVEDEARELRRFDHVREEPRGRGRGRPGGGKPYAGKGKRGPGAGRGAGPRDDNFGNRADAGRPGGGKRGPGGKPRGPRGDAQPTHGHDHNPAAFRSWYVPEGVETGSKVAPPRAPRGAKPPRPYGNKPAGAAGAGARGPSPYGGPKKPGGGGPRKAGGGGGAGRPGGGGGARPGGGGPRPGGGNRGFKPRRPEGLPSDD